MENLKNSSTMTPNQPKELLIHQQELMKTVDKVQNVYSFSKENPLIDGAQHGVKALSLSEASWLNQKDWEPEEKTFILYYIDKERNKRKKNYDLRLTYVLASLSSLAYLSPYDKRLAVLLSFAGLVNALSVGIDYIKDRKLDKMTQQHFNQLAETNDNVKTALHCLTPKTTYSR